MSNLEHLKAIQSKIDDLKNDNVVKSILEDTNKQDLLTKLEQTIEKLGKEYE